MPPRIGPRLARRVFLKEWREKRRLTQTDLGNRVGVTGTSIHRWENSRAQLSTPVMAALEEALDVSPGGLFRHPDQPSADDLLRDAPPAVIDQAMAYLRYLTRKAGS
jgi:transcriptional regulator with XRE-family HTH domain